MQKIVFLWHCSKEPFPLLTIGGTGSSTLCLNLHEPQPKGSMLRRLPNKSQLLLRCFQGQSWMISHTTKSTLDYKHSSLDSQTQFNLKLTIFMVNMHFMFVIRVPTYSDHILEALCCIHDCVYSICKINIIDLVTQHRKVKLNN